MINKLTNKNTFRAVFCCFDAHICNATIGLIQISHSHLAKKRAAEGAPFFGQNVALLVTNSLSSIIYSCQ